MSENLYKMTIGFIAIVIVSIAAYLILCNPLRNIYINETLKVKQKQKTHNYQNDIQRFSSRIAPDPGHNELSNSKRKLAKTPNIQQIINHIKLFKMYHDGIPDQYDSDGNKIKGIQRR